jgi:type I restriction enzyme S subunit
LAGSTRSYHQVRGNVAKLEGEIANVISKALGLKPLPKQTDLPIAFGLCWKDLLRWGVSFNRHPLNPKTLLHSKYFPTVQMIEVAFVNPSTKITVTGEEIVTFVPMEAVSDVEGQIVAPKHVPYAQVAKGYTKFQENDVIWAKITPCMQNGKSAVARNLKGGIGFGSTEFHVLRPRDQQQRVPVDFLEDLVIPLPPLDVQQQIVNMVNRQRQMIAEERKTAEERQMQAAREVEEMLLGIRPVR